ncbi:MAG: hypothetical protein ACOCTT_03795 [archaeon]
MPITSKDFPSLTDDLQSIFFEAAKRKIGDNTGYTVFDVKGTERLNHEHQILHGIKGIQKLAEGEDFPKTDAEEGDSIIWTQEHYGAIVPITKKMRKFDLHSKITKVAKKISEDAFDKVDQSLADRLLGGFSNTYTDPYGETQSSLGPDGKSLFANNHDSPSGSETFSNLIREGSTYNPPLSRQAIVDTRTAARTHKDPNGQLRPVHLDTIVVPPNLEDLAERIILSEKIPGSANNDRNPLYNKLKIKVWDRLSQASDGTDTSDYWYLMESQAAKDETLKALFAEKPSLDAPDVVYSNKNWEYSLDFYYVTGNGHPAYVFGSDASGSA